MAMLWRGGRRSDNIEDQRGAGGFGGGFGGGGFGGGRMGGGGIRIGGVGLLVIIVIGLLFGVDPATLLSQLEGGGGTYQDQPMSQGGSGGSGAGEDEGKDFVSAVLADTEDTWSGIFRDEGKTYRDPHLVLFSNGVRSACGFAQTAMGPFYCPGDSKVYIDLAFFAELQRRFQAPGDFAQAYVIAHEVGHHVQHLLGITDQVDRLQGQLSETQANALSVRVELQADCFAGIWAFHANQRKIVETGDVEEALNAASAVGDDRLQQESQGTVVPDSFTHGSSAQRVRWFQRGFARGDLNDCDTFNAKSL
jgi:predicted metalloprotease